MHWLRKAVIALGVLGAPASAQLISAQLRYPPAALLAGREGAVGYEVKVAKDGKVMGCHVTRTSSFVDLDQQTCAQLRQTARFKPAVGTNGKPIVSTFAGSLRWQIPRQTIAPTPSVDQANH
ncbi:energy transducer TonB [Sphingomonas sp. RP10(2022)]|uniref:Energy transducer TonB n=1 Tax=Sphingomonas liriopis TaxID=2949094 RepID=A0A9X2KPY7_9SPHN|nr:energy transducer TonB [Sphingomonas liriopis]MCP3735174.1 energy transducer TonB [Sphingomonas liriopis]